MRYHGVSRQQKGIAMDLTTTTGYVAGFPDELSLRELGGMKTADGRSVRHGLLYRGSALLNLTDEQKAKVDSLGLKFILDLRAEGEAIGKEEYVPSGVEYIRIGGMRDENGEEVDFSPLGIGRIRDRFQSDPDAFMRELYSSMMIDSPAVHELVRRFSTGEAPLYFHCSAGKDRTGVCAAILLTILGVSDDDIVREFLLTNEYRASIINLPLEKVPAFLPENERQNWAVINSVQEVNLRAALAAADARYPTRERYFEEEFGLDAEALAAIRAHYLE